jgi:hypothetical protein
LLTVAVDPEFFKISQHIAAVLLHIAEVGPEKKPAR